MSQTVFLHGRTKGNNSWRFCVSMRECVQVCTLMNTTITTEEGTFKKWRDIEYMIVWTMNKDKNMKQT